MSRGHVELVHAPQVAPVPVGLGWPAGAELRTLSVDAETGAVTGVLALPPGYRRGRGHFAVETEFLVLDGTLRIGDTIHEFGFYDYSPSGATHEPWETEAGCRLLLMARGGAPEFVPVPSSDAVGGRLELDTEQLSWELTPIPGPPPGFVVKLLRHDEQTGELCALVGSVPAFDYPQLEFHDCVEEIYCLEGDMWLGNSGTMLPGSYLWRPPYVTHGPFRSRTGCVMLVWTPSTLVNHYVDDPSRTPEENRRARAGAGGER